MEETTQFEEDKKGDVLIMRIQGRLDAISSPVTEKKVLEKIIEGSHKLILNFSEVDYLSSAGMRMLLTTTKKIKTLSGQLIVCSISSNVMDILKMSGFDHILQLAESEEEALSKF